MFFNSYEFLLGFLPVVCLVYFLLAKYPRAGTWWLVAASFVFYAKYRVSDVAVLAASILWNYLVSLAIFRLHRRRLYLILGIAVNLLVLGIFKYRESFASALGANRPQLGSFFHGLQFPLGISFFTFSQIAYLVDVYRRIDKPSPVRDYALFVTFFPHLLSGPILRHRVMFPQFESPRRRRIVPRYFARGLALIVIGLAKKILIADPLAPMVARTFDSIGALDPGTAWLGTFAYTFQLYNDFSGYCDIAAGIAFLLNIRIPENFRAPYGSASIQEFWRRWHVSLGRFLRDYIYIPLGGNRAGLSRQCGAILVTFTLGGLWHGAGWTFLLWGALHGTALAINVLWKRIGIGMPRILGWALTFSFVHLAWVVFRAPDLEALARVLRALMAGLGPIPRLTGQMLSQMDTGTTALIAAILIAAMPGYSFVMAKRMQPNLWTASLAGILLTVVVLRFSSVTYFLYYFF